MSRCRVLAQISLLQHQLRSTLSYSSAVRRCAQPLVPMSRGCLKLPAVPVVPDVQCVVFALIAAHCCRPARLRLKVLWCLPGGLWRQVSERGGTCMEGASTAVDMASWPYSIDAWAAEVSKDAKLGCDLAKQGRQ